MEIRLPAPALPALPVYYCLLTFPMNLSGQRLPSSLAETKGQKLTEVA